jgi:hypothetical protein
MCAATRTETRREAAATQTTDWRQGTRVVCLHISGASGTRDSASASRAASGDAVAAGGGGAVAAVAWQMAAAWRALPSCSSPFTCARRTRAAIEYALGARRRYKRWTSGGTAGMRGPLAVIPRRAGRAPLYMSRATARENANTSKNLKAAATFRETRMLASTVAKNEVGAYLYKGGKYARRSQHLSVCGQN